MKTTIFFDMDGTIANLYEYENGLPELRAENPHPYAIAKPMLRFSVLARMIHKAQRNGYAVGIITWGSKEASPEYNEAVFETKKAWLRKHLASVQFDEINFAPYGTPKSNFANSTADILFDDEAPNRENWVGTAYTPDKILEILANLR